MNDLIAVEKIAQWQNMTWVAGVPCPAAGVELEQIQILLGHASVQATERYLGTKQDLLHAPNDAIKLRVPI
jgi:integrase